MIYLEKKVAIFKDMVYNKKEKEAKKKIQQAQETYKKLLEEKRQDLDRQEEALVTRRQDLAKRQGVERLSSLKEKNRMEVLAKEEALFNDLVENLKKDLEAFQKTEAYLDLEGKKLMDIFLEEEGAFVLYTLKEEEDLAKHLMDLGRKKGFTLTSKDLDPSYLGGFILAREDGAYLYNRTLQRDLEDHRYLFGARLHKALKGQEDQE